MEYSDGYRTQEKWKWGLPPQYHTNFTIRFVYKTGSGHRKPICQPATGKANANLKPWFLTSTQVHPDYRRVLGKREESPSLGCNLAS